MKTFQLKLAVATMAMTFGATAMAASSSVFTATTTQKGSLLWWPRVEWGGWAECYWQPTNGDWRTNQDSFWPGEWKCNPIDRSDDLFRTTFVQITNDNDQSDVLLKCYYMDGKKHHADFKITLSSNETRLWDVATGQGTRQGGSAFPTNSPVLEDGEDLPTPDSLPACYTTGDNVCDIDDESWPDDYVDAHYAGELICWAIYAKGDSPRSYNWLTGKATLLNNAERSSANNYYAYDYNPYAFFAHSPNDKGVANAGNLQLKGLPVVGGKYQWGNYDACGAYAIAQYVPLYEMMNIDEDTDADWDYNYNEVIANQLTLAACTQDLRVDKVKPWGAIVVDAYDWDEQGYTGTYGCVDSWSELLLTGTIFQDADDGGWVIEDDDSDLSAAFVRIRGGTASENATACAGKVPADGVIRTDQVAFIGLHATFWDMDTYTTGNYIYSAEAVSATTLTHAGARDGSIKYTPGTGSSQGD